MVTDLEVKAFPGPGLLNRLSREMKTRKATKTFLFKRSLDTKITLANPYHNLLSFIQTINEL